MKKISSVVITFLVLIIGVFGQNSQNLDEVLEKTSTQTTNYQEAFKNLLALETKTFETFDKNGQLKKQNKVESDFLVYQSSKNNKISFELRNVKSVDGKPIPSADQNAEQFFAELNKATTLKSQLEKIQKTSSKYDKTLDVSGLTLYEGIILSNNLRPFFDFSLEPMQDFQGRQVFVLNYQQTKSSPFISINGKGVDINNPGLEFDVEIPGEFKKNEILLRGKFYIDAQTFQILREERELTVQSNEPLVLLRTEFDYQPSAYEILVPKQISLILNDIKKNDGKFSAVKNTKITFDYTNFRKTETDVKILDDTEN
ncbi:MAG: hypothetical protein K1X72_03315 [Pyrinomonadaceae bacterium]|nr:hypothetical protein [Pyrinomonadaceae bacterium]